MSLKAVQLERPAYYPEGIPGECEGVQFQIDESLRGVERDRVNYLAAGVHLAQRRLAEAGKTPYEDAGAVELLLEHWQACRPHVKGILAPKGKSKQTRELSPSEVQEYLDALELAARLQLCRAVVEANELGRKNV